MNWNGAEMEAYKGEVMLSLRRFASDSLTGTDMHGEKISRKQKYRSSGIRFRTVGNKGKSRWRQKLLKSNRRQQEKGYVF